MRPPPTDFYERPCEAFRHTPQVTLRQPRINGWWMLPLWLNPVQTSNESSESWKASVGWMPHSSGRQQTKSPWTETVKPNEKQIQKWNRKQPCHSGTEELRPRATDRPAWKGETKQRPPLPHEQCALCRDAGPWSSECPHRRGTKGSKKFSQHNNEKYQPELAVQNLITWPEQNQTRKTGLPDPGPPGAHGHDESTGQSMTFTVDPGAEHSVVTIPVAPLTGRTETVVGATGDMAACSFCKACSCQLGSHLGTHEFLSLPERPIPLLGRDLLTKLGVQITFVPRKPASLTLGRQSALMMAVAMPREEEWCLYSSGREQINPPRLPEEFPFGQKPCPHCSGPQARTPAGQKWYPGPREARLEIQDHTQCPRDARILIESQSPWNTLLLPIKKSGRNDYCPIQHLCAINSAVITIHPVVPDPYTLLSLLPAQASWFTCLDLKDAFFCLSACHQPASPCLPLNGKTQTPGERHSWLGLDCHKASKTHLPKSQLTGEALAASLAAFPGETLNCTYSSTWMTCCQRVPPKGTAGGTKSLLALLSTTGYRCHGKRLRPADRRSSACGLSSKRASGAWTWEEASHLFNASAEHQARSPWVPRGCRIQLSLDTGFLWNCQAFV